DTMSAILREDPPDLSVTNQNISPGLERIVRHCLEKNPEQRFHSAHDVAFALDALTGASSPGGLATSSTPTRSRTRSVPLLLAALSVAVAGALGFFARDLRGKPELPSFQRLTFRRGTVWTARFAPDGQTVVYGAAWEANPIEVFLTRPESPESRPLGLKNASLFDVSATGELAVMLGAKTTSRSYERFGTLARVPLAGGSPRPLLVNVRYADWSPDGKELMVERVVAGKHRIEFPIGKLIYESPNRIETPRISPEGNAIAFFQVSPSEDVAVCVVDLSGKARILARAPDWWNLGWSPDGSEVWYAAPEPGMASLVSSLQAVSLSGKRRLILRFPGTFEFQDVARDGRVLFGRVSLRPEIIGLAPGEKKERELSWLDGSRLADLSADGRTSLIAEEAEGGGPNQSVYLRSTDGSPATLIGEGAGQALSPDGLWILSTARTTPRKLILLPTGAGTPRPLEFEGLTGGARGLFFPDGESLLLVDGAPGQLPRTYVGSVEGGKPRALGPPGLVPFSFGNPISPDGRFVVLIDDEKRTFVLPAGGGPPVPLKGLAEGEFPIQWSADSGFLFTHRTGELPAKVWRHEIATGRKELLREIAPSDPAGVTTIETILVTPDGRSFAYAYAHNLTDLYVVEGLK
ncbi:MAG: hypothetical protein ABI610_08740, partial [Acidobacteriota bacterium]